MELSSKSIGKVLRIFLFIAIGFNVIGMVISYFFAFQSEFFEQHLMTFDQFTSLFFTLTMFILYILYLVWLFKVHKDLKQLDPEYPISPGGALARVMIPFYNLWGMWNVYAAMAKYLKQFPEENAFGEKLTGYIPFYYFLFFISNSINRYLARGSINVGSNMEMAWILSYATDFILTIFYILIVINVTSALKTLLASRESEEVQTDEEIVTV